MMAEAGLVEQRSVGAVRHLKSKVGYVNKAIKKSRCKKRSKQPALISPVPAALQELFDSCRQVFKGPGSVPPPSDVHRICQILDKMKPEDVGLSRNLQFFRASDVAKGTPRVTYTTIYQCNEFSLCIFFLPATAVIPLHNHPEMTVFSKLLLGKMHIKSYDFVEQVGAKDPVAPSQVRLAKLEADSVFTSPCNTSVLYPTTGGNIHQFTAITPCAVLDVLGPPYSKEDGRDGCYYKEFPYSAFKGDQSQVSMDTDQETPALKEDGNSYGWLEEIEVPENSQMDRIEYLGPQVA